MCTDERVRLTTTRALVCDCALVCDTCICVHGLPVFSTRVTVFNSRDCLACVTKVLVDTTCLPYLQCREVLIM